MSKHAWNWTAVRRNDDDVPAKDRILSVLDAATRELIVVASGVHSADEKVLSARMAAARAAGTSDAWLEELMLMAVLFVGFPRALVTARALRRVVPDPGDPGDAADYTRWPDWKQRGEATCRRVYGDHYDAMRQHVAALNPVLEAWVMADGYGRTLSRTGLDIVRRELCVIAMLLPQEAPRQLHSHLRGALNAGARKEDVDETLRLIEAIPDTPQGRVATARALWAGLR